MPRAQLASIPSSFWDSGALLSEPLTAGAERTAHVHLAWGLVPALGQNPAEFQAQIHAPDFFGCAAEGAYLARTATTLSVGELEKLLTLEIEGATQTADDAGIGTWQPPDEGRFRSHCEDLFRKFESGELKKAVPIVAETLKALPPRRTTRARALLSAIRSGTAGYLYGFWKGEEGMLGLTPELLFGVESQRLRTFALAGTRDADSGDALLKDPKELAEHEWVIQDLTEQFAGLGSVTRAPTQVARFGKIAHLKTDLEIELTSAAQPFGAWIDRLHPSAALGAYPRAAGKKWLVEHAATLGAEMPRGHFGAPFGWSREGRGICVVAIRGLFWRAGMRAIPAGCGVVPGSEPMREFAELALKRSSVRRVLGL